jgi:hypothetical protein
MSEDPAAMPDRLGEDCGGHTLDPWTYSAT